jgi:hypothetical protein
MSEPQPARLDRVVAFGVLHVVDAERGHELRIYRSPEDALRDGVGEETAARLFEHVAGAGETRDILPLCMVVTAESAVTCDSHGCPGRCGLFSVPSNWKWSDPPPRREPSTAIREAGRIYFCQCDRGDE